MKVVVALLVGAVLIFLFIIIILAVRQIFIDSGKTPVEITLEEGKYSWEVYVGSERQIWNLSYTDYDSLPVHNSDWPAVLTYKGRRYTMYRVFSNQIRVSPPLSE